MRRTRRLTLLLIMILTVLVATCGSGCGGRPYAAYKGVGVFTDAVWAKDATGQWHLAEARWQFEKNLTDEDIQYQFREGRVLTPGWLEEILNRLEEGKQ